VISLPELLITGLWHWTYTEDGWRWAAYIRRWSISPFTVPKRATTKLAQSPATTTNELARMTLTLTPRPWKPNKFISNQRLVEFLHWLLRYHADKTFRDARIDAHRNIKTPDHCVCETVRHNTVEMSCRWRWFMMKPELRRGDNTRRSTQRIRLRLHYSRCESEALSSDRNVKAEKADITTENRAISAANQPTNHTSEWNSTPRGNVKNLFTPTLHLDFSRINIHYIKPNQHRHRTHLLRRPTSKPHADFGHVCTANIATPT